MTIAPEVKESLPKEATLDSAFALLAEGNDFIFRRCQKYHSDIFQTRLLGKKTTCISGQEAAREFYKAGRLTRQGAIPPNVLRLLQDKGSVATMDGDGHHWRKQMFMSLMQPTAIDQMTDIFERFWDIAIEHWETRAEIVLLDEVEKILLQAACEWVGIPPNQTDIPQRAKEISAMIDGAGSVGPRNWKGTRLRWKTERWARDMIRRTRASNPAATTAKALTTIAFHRDIDGHLLRDEVAAVELLNILRPTVAIGRYILFAALAIHEFPDCRTKLLSGDHTYTRCFVQEVRRYYPFFPFIGGLVKEEFQWRGHHFRIGERVLLDLYGTNHDPRLWDQPEIFNPDRFRKWRDSAFTLIPQGGGDFNTNHRCAGEWLTIAIIQRAVFLLVERVTYDVKAGDLRIDITRMPAQPRTPLILRNIKKCR